MLLGWGVQNALRKRGHRANLTLGSQLFGICCNNLWIEVGADCAVFGSIYIYISWYIPIYNTCVPRCVEWLKRYSLAPAFSRAYSYIHIIILYYCICSVLSIPPLYSLVVCSQQLSPKYGLIGAYLSAHILQYSEMCGCYLVEGYKMLFAKGVTGPT